FAGYVTDFKGTPIIYPILGPTGKKMTRDFPMLERKDLTESKDHPHHRSLWFTHGNVNGLDFWMLEKQKIVHRKFVKTEIDHNTALIVTENDWLDKNNQPVCSDVRTFRFGVFGETRYIDFDVTVTAVQDSVVFGDTKEGTLGLRVAGTMDLIAKKRDSNSDWGGHIVNAEGIKDNNTWAKRSNWVDYYGPVEGETLGIAVLNHPSSFRYPTYWHVRDYGLFAANPFGVHDFEGKTEKIGEHKMRKGESFTLRYRILFHKGDAESAGIAEIFEQYKFSE
ncbi:MAG: PmoA family protein, partial [Planctomycetaceae bacterium]|nr:PmoA family protein [Planctomycetaceae bacterium]